MTAPASQSPHAGDSSRRANRLAASSSPYLLQHAHNPVDWWPWCDEAFEEAKRRDVPVFLSVGYSTCYWCHVMERESFESMVIARQLNEDFVSIKLDREERPDLDEVYMAATQMLTGHGGWPMSVFLDPSTRRPFWAGTYFPPLPARGMPSFPQVLSRMSQAWREQRELVVQQGETVAGAIREKLGSRQQPVPVGGDQVGMAVQTLLTIFDRAQGGFGGAPKFPQPVYLELLLAVRARIGDPAHSAAVDEALRRTLDAMALGGIFDHVGGGFHRYSVDASWTVPHFEKMLYDNAQLLGVYAQAAADLNDPFYAHVAGRIVEYIRREMTSPTGMFYTAQDAEVDGREGLSYIWTAEQIRAALPADDAAFALEVYGLNAGKNFQDPHHPDAPAVNVLRLAQRPDAATLTRLDAINAELLKTRMKRKQPRLDDKIVRSWNGLMIAALARAGRLLKRPLWIAAAERAAYSGFGELFGSNDKFGRRVARVTESGVTYAGELLLEDAAAEAHAYAELALAGGVESRGGKTAIDSAKMAVEVAYRLFGDGAGGVFDSGESPDLFVRPRSTYDGAMPSGASVLLNALVDLYELGVEPPDRALDLLGSISGAVHESPIATANATRALLRLLALSPGAVAQAQKDAGPAPMGQGEIGVPVEVYASESEIEVGPDAPAELHVKISIAEGWHINDAFAGDASHGTVQALVIGIAGGTGVQPYAEYPAGERIETDASGAPPHGVLKGDVVFPIVLERVGEWTGRPKLLMTYQACSDRACMAPVTVELQVEITKLD
ncbi:MAG: thioredoxin domain-containing protein [Phycisphaerales bacterium]